MGSLKLKIHPLFWLFGVYYALTGKVMMFIICTTVALLHELGHSFSAERLGYRLKSITLMPYGAVVSGEDSGLKAKDEIRIALAGPLTNLAIGTVFVAAWWLFPETYAFTDSAAFSSFSIAAINLLPAFPLDGGRVLLAALSQRVARDKALKICKIVSVAIAAAVLGLFIVSLFSAPNFSILFFAAFIVFGALSKKGENVYVRLFAGASAASLQRGLPYKKQALSVDADVKKLISMLDVDALNEIVLFKDGQKVKTLTQEEITEICQSHSIYDKLSDVV
ncbi:MAG: hypothetical protein DBX59_05200 [Bacillota bacterium]|nr:MAG: hypothetical protein DBX59_05200 [Bacillota bacterium]